MKKYISLLLKTSLMAVLITIAATAQPTSYRLVRAVNFNKTFAGGFPNTIKMFDIAHDDRRNLLYTHGFPTRNVAVIDAISRRQIGSFAMPATAQLTTLAVNPVNGYVLITTPESSPVRAYLVNPATGSSTGTYQYSRSPSGRAFDRAQNRIFLSDGVSVKVLNGSSMQEISTINPQMQAGGLQVDSAANELYVCGRDVVQGNIDVKVFSLASLTQSRSYRVPASAPHGNIMIEPTKQRFFLLGLQSIKKIDYTLGSTTQPVVTDLATFPASANSITYLPDVQTFYASDEDGYTAQGTKGTWSKLYRFNITTNRTDSLLFGDKCYNLVADTRRNLVFGQSMHSGHVHILNGMTSAIDSVDVSESLDDIAATPDGQTVMCAKRLGGSRVVMYTPQSGSVSETRSGNWPAIVFGEAIQGKSWLYAVNMQESTVSFIDAATKQVTKTVSLGIPECRTDAIITGSLDAKNNLLYVAVPEYGSLAVVNTATQAMSRVLTLPRYVFDIDTEKAVGSVQVAAAPDVNKVFVLLKTQRILLAYNTTTGVWDSLSLSGTRYPQNLGAFESKMLVYDARGQRLFVGNQILNPTDLASTGALAQSRIFLGYNSSGTVAYGLTSRGDTITMQEHNSTTLQMQASRPLYVAEDSFMPSFCLSEATNSFYVSGWNYPILRHFDLTQTAALTTGRKDEVKKLKYEGFSVSPNPSSNLATVYFSLETSRHVVIKIFNVLGQEIATVLDETLPAGEHQTLLEVSHLSLVNQTLFLQLKTNNQKLQTIPLQVLQ
jgi:YVTN family beta-propeller protein